MFTHNGHVSPAHFRQPAPACIPRLDNAQLCALYVGARTGGDFFEFLEAGDSLVFVLLDIAGRREEALHIAAAVQDLLRNEVPRLFGDVVVNRAESMTELAIAINAAVLEAAGGVRCCPGFVGCYDISTGTLVYVNAGHVPALVRDGDEVRELEANGLPFGLFSHVTRDPQFYLIEAEVALLLVSKGVVETKIRRGEFGLDGVKKLFAASSTLSAQQLCEQILEKTKTTAEKRLIPLLNGEVANDRTAVALVRAAAASAATNQA